MNLNLADAIEDAVKAIEERGVQDPAVVLEDDGNYSYIPGAYLSDASYTGSRQVVLQINDPADLFGPEYEGWDQSAREYVEEQAETWIQED